MKTKFIISKYGLVLLAAALCTLSCKKDEMSYYDQPYAITFLGTDNRGRDSDDPSTLNASLNFASRILDMTAEGIDTITVKLRLQGNLSDKPLRVSIYSEKDENYPFAVVKPMNPYVIDDSTYRVVIKVPVQCPAERHKDYKAILKFDYGNSDVIAGFNTLQTFTVTLKDEFSQSMITGLNYWSYDYQPVIGDYSENKVRFMIEFAQTYNFQSFFGYYGPSAAKAQELRDALKAYNDANPGNPLKDEDGNLISFDPA